LDPFLFRGFSDPRDAHSIPTRRSSDLYDADMHTFYPDAIREIATLTAQAFGCTAEVAITEGYPVLVNHADAVKRMWAVGREVMKDRKSTRLNSSHVKSSYAVFCLKKKT